MTKIAIIEDDPVISQMYRMKFEADGFDVRVAGDGAVGIELVQQFSPDIVLLDLQMPEVDGVSALTTMRAHDWGKHVLVVILTNLGEEEAPEAIKQLNVHSYIVKANLTPRQVVAHVKAAIDSQS